MGIRVAIFEDNPIMLDAFCAILGGTDGFIVAGAEKNANDLHHCMKRYIPDVVLMDIEMPGGSGIVATAEIAKSFPDSRVLIQTVFEDEEKIWSAICAGAHGYILKKTPPAQLIEAITDVHNGGGCFSPGIAMKVTELFRRLVPSPADTGITLTAREKEVLQLMAEGLNLPAVSQKLFLGYETIRGYVKSIYRKLHVNSAAEAVSLSIRKGIIK